MWDFTSALFATMQFTFGHWYLEHGEWKQKLNTFMFVWGFTMHFVKTGNSQSEKSNMRLKPFDFDLKLKILINSGWLKHSWPEKTGSWTLLDWTVKWSVQDTLIICLWRSNEIKKKEKRCGAIILQRYHEIAKTSSQILLRCHLCPYDTINDYALDPKRQLCSSLLSSLCNLKKQTKKNLQLGGRCCYLLVQMYILDSVVISVYRGHCAMTSWPIGASPVVPSVNWRETLKSGSHKAFSNLNKRIYKPINKISRLIACDSCTQCAFKGRNE